MNDPKKERRRKLKLLEEQNRDLYPEYYPNPRIGPTTYRDGLILGTLLVVCAGLTITKFLALHDWSWWIVLAPIWVFLGLMLLATGLIMTFIVVGDMWRDWQWKKKTKRWRG